MNPFPQRIAELHEHLATRWGVTDTQAVDILLTSLLPASFTAMKRPWIILETDYPSRDTAAAWFSLGGTLTVRSLAVPRVLRSRAAEAVLHNWILMRKADSPGVWVDAEWRRLPASGRGAGLLMATHSYAILLAMCVRLRTIHPKGPQATLLNRSSDLTELARLTSRVLDPDLRTPSQTVSNLPQSFLYWCELLQKLCPIQTDWESLTGNLSAIARGISLLYNDSRPPDWSAAERVMRDTIPYMTQWILDEATLLRNGGKTHFKEFIAASASLDTYTIREIKRLRAHAILTDRKNYSSPPGYRWHPWKFRINSPDYRTLSDRTQKIL
jgi:hypothetical protein